MKTAEPHALTDVLCPHCRVRLADGWLDGEPCCATCADLVIARWVMLDADPWAPVPELDDDPFFHHGG